VRACVRASVHACISCLGCGEEGGARNAVSRALASLIFFHGQDASLGQRSPTLRIFLFFLAFFSVRGKVSINPLLPSYMTYTSSRIFWSFHMSYRVCLVPAESDSNGACSAGAVAAMVRVRAQDSLPCY
jgi:hypothetical protein